MFKTNVLILLTISIVFLLTGCSTVPNVHLKESFWSTPKQGVVVAFAKPPVPQLYQEGGGGLLDLAVNEVAANSFNKYLKKYSLQELTSLKETFIT